MRKDVREFIRRLEAAGLTVESTPGHYRVLRDGKPLRKANGFRSCWNARVTASAV
jgi:biotin operon repressor